jgi:hypothetical protein
LPKLIVTVDQEGNVEIDAVGFSGNECLAASKPFEKALGNIAHRTIKPDLLKEREGVKNATKPKNRNNI